MPRPKLIPANSAALAKSTGRLPVAFGRRFFLFLFAGLIWIAPAWQDHRYIFAMLLWDVMALMVWAWDLQRMPKPEQLEVRRIWSAPLGLAQRTRIKLQLYNSSGQKIVARISDDAPVALCRELPEVEVAAEPGSTGSVEYEAEPRARGDAHFGAAWLRYQSPFQFAERWAKADLAQTVRVYPNIANAQRMQIYLIRSRQIELEKRLKRQRGQGREFESLRDYRQGDEQRDICWSATARRGKLITKVYQVERSQTVWLVLDAGRLLRTRVNHLSKLDYAVDAALCLAQVAFHSGDRVALLAYGRRPQQNLAPARGVPQLRAIMESLSQVHSEPYEADHVRAAKILLSIQRQRSLVVWLTDLAETAATPVVIECAARLATRHLVLLGVINEPELPRLAQRRPEDVQHMYQYMAALEVVHRRDLLLRRLRQQGALTMEVAPTQLSTALVNRYLEVKERSLL